MLLLEFLSVYGWNVTLPYFQIPNSTQPSTKTKQYAFLSIYFISIARITAALDLEYAATSLFPYSFEFSSPSTSNSVVQSKKVSRSACTISYESNTKKKGPELTDNRYFSLIA